MVNVETSHYPDDQLRSEVQLAGEEPNGVTHMAPERLLRLNGSEGGRKG